MVIALFITKLSTCINAESAEQGPSYQNAVTNLSGSSPSQVWENFTRSNMDEARALVAPQYYNVFTASFPPGSELLKKFQVESEEIFGDVARVRLVTDITIGETVKKFRGWLPFSKDTGHWKLTLAEKPVLEFLTKDWKVEDIGPIKYHTKSGLSQKLRADGLRFVEEFRRLSANFRSSLIHLDYYVASNEEEAELLGIPFNPGGAQARPGLIKTLDDASHIHELIHVFRVDVGTTNTFLEEGLASALGDGYERITSAARCHETQALLAQGYVRLFDSNEFSTATFAGKPSYEGARFLMEYWLDQFGLDKVLEMMVLAAKSPNETVQIISRTFEEPSLTDQQIQLRLNAKCQALSAEVNAGPT